MAAAMIANLEEYTGKSLPQWIKIAKKSGLEKHGMTHGYASLVAMQALKAPSAEPAGEALVATRYAGKKAGLRPIYDALTTACASPQPDRWTPS